MNIFQVDAFNDEIFKGNPAAVIPLKSWIPDNLMQKIAEENNLSETVFFVRNQNDYDIKWYTPTCEIDLCGHATLAAAHIIFTELNYKDNCIRFHSKSGLLTVRRDGGWYALNFPAESVRAISCDPRLESAFSAKVLNCYKGKWKLIAELENESAVKNLAPNFHLLSQLDADGIIATAKGDKVDFVSRFFAPKLGINEDPVTGSAHTLLIPYWSEKLNKADLNARQISTRVGILKCRALGKRVEMCGKAVTYLKGKLTI